MAGRDWFTSFLQRHPQLSIRNPEATPLARDTAFNHHTVGEFFNALESALRKSGAPDRRIVNLDETDFTTVQVCPKVDAGKGMRQMTSSEKGELVTMCACITAAGTALPPVFNFPRKHFKAVMLLGAPESSLGLAHGSGWMTSENFLKVLQHVVLHTDASLENPLVLTMDNHDSHLSYAAMQYAKTNGIHIVTLPPHTSQKTQPLDRTVFGPMKAYYNQAANSWMLRNPGRTLSIYDVASLINEAFIKAMTPSNIMAGFKASGIWPFDCSVFNDDAFLPSEVTNQSLPVQDHENTASANVVEQSVTLLSTSDGQSHELPLNVTSDGDPSHSESGPASEARACQTFVSPEHIHGYRKVGTSKQNK